MKVADIANLFSIGSVAQHLGASVREVDEAADELGIVAVMAIASVPYIDVISVARIEDYITARRNGTSATAQQPAKPSAGNSASMN